MNILILNWRDPANPKAGGAELVTLAHAKEWIKNGDTVTWFTSYFAHAKTQEYIQGVNIIRQGNAISVYVLAPIFYLSARKRFDIVIDEIHGIPFFTPLYVTKPKIAFIHEIAGEIWDYMYPFPINYIGRLIEKLYFSLYKNIAFWTDAESTATGLINKGIKEKNITVIHCPITNAVLTTLPQKEVDPTYIFVSRMVKMKGIEHIIAAFSRIQQKDTNAKLWIVGTGEYSYIQKLQRMVQSYGLEKHVIFWGKVTNERKLLLMKKAHILLHASVNEGWGLVVIEAASQATPAVVYNVNGLRDSVKNGQTGIVITQNTPAMLATAALSLQHDTSLYVTMQKKALEWARSLTWNIAGNKSSALLKAVEQG